MQTCKITLTLTLVTVAAACTPAPGALEDSGGRGDSRDAPVTADATTLDAPASDVKPPTDATPDATCGSLCDCEQGRICSGGKCVADKVPRFCCTKAGCPAGQLCTFPDKKKGVCSKCAKDADCGAPGCQGLVVDCVQSALKCDTKTAVCSQASTVVKSATCDGVTGKCTPRPSCTKDADCGAQTCKVLGADCVKITPKCAAAAGTCSAASAVVKNASCDVSGICIPKATCTKDADCGAKACKVQVIDCVQLTPKCNTAKKTCGLTSALVKSAICPGTGGMCTPRPSCTKDADCGGPICLDGRGDCTQITPTCNLATGACSAVTTAVKSASCSAATGACIQKPSCTKHADCGAQTCAAAGSDCTQNKPVCDPVTGFCAAVKVVAKSAVCIAASGLCQPGVTCAKAADCGAPGCATFKPSCAQMKPTCDTAKKTCSLVWTVAKDSKCGAGGLCVPSVKLCTSHCDCAQGFTCLVGKCLYSTLPVYCCGKSGCPTGSKCKYADGKDSSC